MSNVMCVEIERTYFANECEMKACGFTFTYKTDASSYSVEEAEANGIDFLLEKVRNRFPNFGFIYFC